MTKTSQEIENKNNEKNVERKSDSLYGGAKRNRSK